MTMGNISRKRSEARRRYETIKAFLSSDASDVIVLATLSLCFLAAGVWIAVTSYV